MCRVYHCTSGLNIEPQLHCLCARYSEPLDGIIMPWRFLSAGPRPINFGSDIPASDLTAVSASDCMTLDGDAADAGSDGRRYGTRDGLYIK